MLFAAVHESESGTSRTSGDVRLEFAKWAKADRSVSSIAIGLSKKQQLTELSRKIDARSAAAVG
jgi:hypothetical protein